MGRSLHALRNLPPFIRMVYKVQPGLATLVVGLRLLRSLCPPIMLWIGGLILDTVVTLASSGQRVDRDLRELLVLVVFELVAAAVGEAAARCSVLVEALLSQQVSHSTDIMLMESAAALDLAQLETPSTHDSLDRARTRTEWRSVLIALLTSTAQELVTLVALLGLLLHFHPYLAVLLVLASLAPLISETYFGDLGHSLLFRTTPERRQLEYLRLVCTAIDTSREVRALGLAHFFVSRYDAIATRLRTDARSLMTRRTLVGMVLILAGLLVYYLAYVVLLQSVVTGTLGIGMLVLLGGALMQGREMLVRTSLSVSEIAEHALHLGDLFTFLALKPQMTTPSTPRRIRLPLQEGIRFESVSFRHAGAETWAIRDLTLSLRVGELVALVGKNGSGKSSIVKLLARLYDPTEGRILLDDVDIREFDLDEFRRTVGVVFQDFVKYSLTLRENVTIGDVEDRTDDVRLDRAAASSGLASVCLDLPAGYEQMLTSRFEKGRELSGGEWQKVALARAYYRPAPVLILDEPSAALDPRSEREVLEYVAHRKADAIRLLVSHRLSTVQLADRVVVLDGGLMVQEGSPRELLLREGPYRRLFEPRIAEKC